MNTSFDKEKLEKAMKQAERGAEGLTDGLTQNLKSYSEGALNSVAEGYDNAIAWAKRNPLQAAAIGAGIGFVLGMAIRKFVGRNENGSEK